MASAGARTDSSKGPWLDSLALWALLLSGAALGAFAGTSAILLADGSGTAKPQIVKGNPDHERASYEYATAAYEHYLWHFADAIPLLKVTETTKWKPDHALTGGPHGVLTVLAKFVLMLPVLGLGAIALAGWTANTFGNGLDREPAQQPGASRNRPSDAADGESGG